MTALPHLSAIRISGSDAAEFLHNQLSADVKGLSSGESTWACYCEPKGRVLALLLVVSFEGGFYVILSSALAQVVADRMKIYVMRSKVEIAVLSKMCVIGFEEDEGNEGVARFIHAIPIPHSSRSLALAETNSTAEIDRNMLGAWQYSELQQGICWLDKLTSGQFLPQMLGFDKLGAVNFKKGCYPGQEIVARTHYLGKIKRHPRLLEMRTDAYVETMGKIRLQANEMTDEAVVVDSKGNDQLGYCVLVVSRVDPESKVERIEFVNA